MLGKKFKEYINKNFLLLCHKNLYSKIKDLPDQEKINSIIKFLLPEGHDIIRINDVHYNIVVDAYKELSTFEFIPKYSETEEQTNTRKKFNEEMDKKAKKFYEDIKKGKIPKLKDKDDMEKIIYYLNIRGYKVNEDDFVDPIPMWFVKVPQEDVKDFSKKVEANPPEGAQMFKVYSPKGTTKKQRLDRFKKITKRTGYNFGGINAYCEFCEEYGAKKRCVRCQDAYYCNKKCQRKHWKIHKKTCKN